MMYNRQPLPSTYSLTQVIMSTPVRHRVMAITAALCAVSLAFTVASCGSQPTSPSAPVNPLPGQADVKTGTDQCVAGGIKDEKAPFTVSAPQGEVVTGVCVKAGTQTFPVSDQNGCYLVSGL